MGDGRTRLLVDLPPGIARRALAIVGDGQGYASISDLIAVALENQFALEAEGEVESVGGVEAGHVTAPSRSLSTGPEATVLSPGLSSRVRFPHDWSPTSLREPVAPTASFLSPFLNRLAPLIVALRKLAQFQEMHGRCPSWEELSQGSALLAREVGLEVRDLDRRLGRSGVVRWWTGFPVGSDETSSLNRYRRHFLGRLDRPNEIPPLLALGLMAPAERGVQFTRLGLDLAREPAPILGETWGRHPLTETQSEYLAKGLSRLNDESSLATDVLRLLEKGESNSVIDDLLVARTQPTKSSLGPTLRSAMLGRLTDCGLTEYARDGSIFVTIQGTRFVSGVFA